MEKIKTNNQRVWKRLELEKTIKSYLQEQEITFTDDDILQDLYLKAALEGYQFSDEMYKDFPFILPSVSEQKLIDLILKQREYIQFLGEQYNDVFYTFPHYKVKLDDVKKGELMREQIKKLNQL
jgi:hypothetical protein